jgi:hypothetical protein
MLPGTPFIYYRGRRAKTLGETGLCYFGTGTIGDTLSEEGDRIVCALLDVRTFDEPVPFRDDAGHYYETRAKQPLHFRNGVRLLDPVDAQRILVAANVGPRDVVDLPPQLHMSNGPNTAAGYGQDAETNALVERYAVEEVLRLLRLEHGSAAVREMARNNEGFDICVARPAGDLHVEVKGTRKAEPVFFLTQAELRHSREAAAYLLVVIHAIDLEARSHHTAFHGGPIEPGIFELQPIQWACRLRSAVVVR